VTGGACIVVAFIAGSNEVMPLPDIGGALRT
jgi:hypothetical protein